MTCSIPTTFTHIPQHPHSTHLGLNSENLNYNTRIPDQISNLCSQISLHSRSPWPTILLQCQPCHYAPRRVSWFLPAFTEAHTVTIPEFLTALLLCSPSEGGKRLVKTRIRNPRPSPSVHSVLLVSFKPSEEDMPCLLPNAVHSVFDPNSSHLLMDHIHQSLVMNLQPSSQATCSPGWL